MSRRSSSKKIFFVAVTAILVMLPLAGIYYLMGSRRFLGTFIYVFGGQLFASGWNRIHAGSALDQPTIGKWYFWFTVFTVLSFPYMAAVRRFFVWRSKMRHWIFVIGLTWLCLFLVCLLIIPFFWLIQYIGAMGFTNKRIWGLLYGLSAYIVILLFYARAIRPRKEKDKSKSTNSA